MIGDSGNRSEASLTGRRVLVIGIEPEVNRSVVEPLVELGILARGSTIPTTAAIEFDAREFDLIAFGRGLLGPPSDSLKAAFQSRNPVVRFVDVIGPTAVNQIAAALKADPRVSSFLSMARDSVTTGEEQ